MSRAGARPETARSHCWRRSAIAHAVHPFPVREEPAMNGLMMDQPLLISSLLLHAERHHGEQEIVSRRVEGDIHRYTYRDMAARSRRMANALRTLDVKPGAVVGTLAWNGYRHLELYYAVSGSGAVLHTLNPRLHADQLTWIA